MADIMPQQIPLREAEYKLLADYVYEKSGISLGTNKQELMKTRLSKRLRVLKLGSYREYYEYLTTSSDSDELEAMINAVSTNFTSFYREKQHFDFLTRTALPEIMRHKKVEGSRRVRAWCAAASSGEEPYTLGLTLAEFFGTNAGWDVKLLATDISTKVLSIAAQGVYELEKVKAVAPALLERYFEKEVTPDGNMFRVSEAVRAMITFRQLNLMDPVFPFKGPFDFISCRNVMIYFDTPTQEVLVDKMLRLLVPGGFLLIGHSENLPASLRHRVDVLAPATYRKVR